MDSWQLVNNQDRIPTEEELQEFIQNQSNNDIIVPPQTLALFKGDLDNGNITIVKQGEDTYIISKAGSIIRLRDFKLMQFSQDDPIYEDILEQLGDFFSSQESSSPIENAISTGEWTSEALTELNNLIDNIENGTVIYKRFPQEASRGFHQGGRINEAASIILRGSGGSNQKKSLSVGERYERDKRQQHIQEGIIESWAKKQGVWFDNLEDITKNKKEIASGGEAKVFYDGNGTATKIITTEYFITPQFALDRITLHNTLFPEAPLTLKGFGRNSENEFVFICDQPFIEGTTPTMDEIQEFIEKAGFKKSNKDRGNTYTNESIYLSDLHDENVIKTPQGHLVVIDADVRFNTPDLNRGGTYQIDDSLVNSGLFNNNSTTADTIEDLTPKISMPQSRVSGQHQYGWTQIARKEITDKLGENTTSIDMVEAGYRTRTTRSTTEAQTYGLSVGDVFEQYGKSSDGSTKKVLTRVTAIYGKDDPRYLGNWHKEGWTDEGIDDIKRLRNGAQVIEFELINNNSTTTNTENLSKDTIKANNTKGAETLWSEESKEYKAKVEEAKKKAKGMSLCTQYGTTSSAWRVIAGWYGFEPKSIKGFNEEYRKAWFSLSFDDKRALDRIYQEAVSYNGGIARNAAKMNFTWKAEDMKNNAKARGAVDARLLYKRVSVSDSIIIIGHISEPGEETVVNGVTLTNKASFPTVNGNAGLAVQYAKMLGGTKNIIRPSHLPVYVYDESKDGWFTWEKDKFVPCETPKLTNHALLLGENKPGTTNIHSALGKKNWNAIIDVFNNTFGFTAHSRRSYKKQGLDPSEMGEVRQQINTLAAQYTTDVSDMSVVDNPMAKIAREIPPQIRAFRTDLIARDFVHQVQGFYGTPANVRGGG